MPEVDCSRYVNQCQKLEQVMLNGLSAAELQRLGITPGSERARNLEEALNDIFLRCCARLSGSDQPPEGPSPTPQPEGPAPVLAGALALPWAGESGGAAAFGPLALLIVVAAFLAAAAGNQVCHLKQRRLMPDGSIRCAYRCPSGVWYYTYEFFGGACLPFIVKPI